MTYEFADTTLAMVAGWLVNLSMIIVAAAVFYQHGVSITSIEQASATLEPLVGNLARLLFGIALLLAGVGSSVTSSMAEANVIAGLLGRAEDPPSRFYRVSLFVTALPALVVVAIPDRHVRRAHPEPGDTRVSSCPSPSCRCSCSRATAS